MHLLTVNQVADRLSTTKRAVQTLLYRRSLTWIDVSATKGSKKPRKRIAESDLLAFIESRKQRVPTFKRTQRAPRYKERAGV